MTHVGCNFAKVSSESPPSEIMSELHPNQDPHETWTDKAKRKFEENPWVPIGAWQRF